MAGLTPSSWVVEIREDTAGGEFHFSGPAACLYREANLAAAFSGSLSNGAQLDRELGTSGSDAERIVRAYRRWGPELAAHLKGFFAFVLQDVGRGSFLAGRDRIGIEPLFVADARSARILSPSFALLRRHAKVPRTLNRLILAQHLVDLWGDPQPTYSQAIRRVPPASTLTFQSGGRTRATTYWNPQGLREGAAPGETTALLRERLSESIRHALSLGDAGIFLSGGVDSISVAALAARCAQALQHPQPTALSLYYRGYELDEEAVQKQVAMQMRLPQVCLGLDEAIDHQPALSKMLDLSARWPVPMGNIWLAAFLRLGERGRHAGARVILTGGGGDEWLGIGPFLAADHLRQLRLVAFMRFAAYMRRSYGLGWGALLHSLGWRFGVKQLVVSARNHVLPALGHDLDASRARRGLPDWIAPEGPLRGELVDSLTEAHRAERLARNASVSLYDHAAQRGLWHPLVQAEIENKAWMGEALGARVLEPYWDADVVELLYRTPPEILSRGGLAKGVVHQMLHELLPGFTLPRQNKVSLVPFYRNAIRRDAAHAWASMKGVTALGDLGLVDPGRLGSRIQRILAGDLPRELWLVPHVLAVESWLRGQA